jgi:hypothetical protein
MAAEPAGVRAQSFRSAGKVEATAGDGPYCVIPFLLPPPKSPCPARATKASQAGRRRFDPGRPLFFLPLITDLRRRLSTFLGSLFAGAGSDAGSAPTEALHGVQLVRRRQVRVALRHRDRLVRAGKVTTACAASIDGYLAGLLTCTETLPAR